MTLPTPRLQYLWRETPDGWLCLYELVLPIGEYDTRREFLDSESVTVLLFVQYQNRGREPISDGEVQLPFPLGAHAVVDRVHLGHLPVYAICGDVVREVLPGVLQKRMEEVG